MEGLQLDRHYKLWEENNNLLKRATFVIMMVVYGLAASIG